MRRPQTSVQQACGHDILWAYTASHSELGQFLVENIRDDDVEHQAEVHEQDACEQAHIHCIIRRPVFQVEKLQVVQQGICDVLQVIEHQKLEGSHNHRRQRNRSVEMKSFKPILLFSADLFQIHTLNALPQQNSKEHNVNKKLPN